MKGSLDNDDYVLRESVPTVPYIHTYIHTYLYRIINIHYAIRGGLISLWL
jgi:hypothetical protein